MPKNSTPGYEVIAKEGSGKCVCVGGGGAVEGGGSNWRRPVIEGSALSSKPYLLLWLHLHLAWI